MRSLDDYRTSIAAIEHLLKFDAQATSAHVVEGSVVGQLQQEVDDLAREHPTVGARFASEDYFAHDVGRGRYFKLPAVRAAVAVVLARIDGAVKAASKPSGDGPPASPTDGVTGLLPRSALDADLPAALASSARAARPCGLIVLDIDRFKTVNDTHGHQAGDSVLRGVADVVKASVAGKGTAYRYGGEEIVICLPNHDLHESTAVAERVRGSIESSVFASLRVTASLGVAALPEHGTGIVELIGAADAAMYDAKKRGRNLVRVSGEAEPQNESARVPARRPPDPEGLTDEEIQSVRAEYFRTRSARCPRDHAILTVREMRALGERVPRLFVSCGLCGLAVEM